MERLNWHLLIKTVSTIPPAGILLVTVFPDAMVIAPANDIVAVPSMFWSFVVEEWFGLVEVPLLVMPPSKQKVNYLQWIKNLYW